MKDLIAEWKEEGKRICVVYVPTALTHVSKRFFQSFMEMTGPSIQEEMERKWNVKLAVMLHDTFPIDRNRNSAIDRAIREFKADFIMSCDADQVFKPYTIPKLMESLVDDVGAVTGIYFRKTGQHRCVCGNFSPWSESLERKRGSLKEQGFIDPKTGNQTLFYKPFLYFDVIRPVDAFGMGCILMKTSIFDKLQVPYFKYVDGYSTGGDFTFEGISEDMWFCSQLKQAGIKVLCDPKVQAGHLVEKVINGNEAED